MTLGQLPNKFLYLDKYYKNPNNKVTVSIHGAEDSFFRNQGKPLIFFIAGDVNFSGTNQFDAPLENAFKEANRLLGLGKALGANLDFISGGFTLKNQVQTILQWVTSDRKSFTLPIFFVKWRKDHSVLEYLKILERATAPEVLPTANDLSLITKAPGGYSVNEKGEIANGTCSFKIGNWFEAHDFVLSTYSLAVSAQDVSTYGDPMFAQGSITVTATKLFDGDTVASWIASNNGDGYYTHGSKF